MGSTPDPAKHEFSLLLEHYTHAEQLDVLDREGCRGSTAHTAPSSDGWEWQNFIGFLYERLQFRYRLPYHKYMWQDELQQVCPAEVAPRPAG